MENTTRIEFHYEPDTRKGYPPVRLCFQGTVFEATVEQSRGEKIQLVGELPTKEVIFDGYEAMLEAGSKVKKIREVDIPVKNFVIPDYCAVAFNDWQAKNWEDFQYLNDYIQGYKQTNVA